MTSVPPRKRKLLFIANNLNTGGVEEVLLTYMKVLDRTRFEPAILFFEAGVVSGEVERLGIQCVHIGTRSRVRRFTGIYAFAKQFRPDIVHNHTGWYGLIIGKLIGAGTVETVHNVYGWFKPIQHFLYGIYVNFADRIIAVSEIVRAFTIAKFMFVPADRLVVIHNGISVPLLPDADHRMRSRLALGIKPDELLIGFIGRLTDQKGVEYLVNALGTVRNRLPNARLIIAGDGPMRPALEKQVQDNDLGGIVSFLGFRRDVPDLYSALDIFVLPSLFEGLPISVLEAMAYGVPVIATEVGGVGEVITNGVDGILVQAMDPGMIAENIIRLAENSDERTRLSTAGRLRVQNAFSAEAMVRRTESLYDEILAGK